MTAGLKESHNDVNSGFDHNQLLSSNHPIAFSWLVLNKNT